MGGCVAVVSSRLGASGCWSISSALAAPEIYCSSHRGSPGGFDPDRNPANAAVDCNAGKSGRSPAARSSFTADWRVSKSASRALSNLQQYELDGNKIDPSRNQPILGGWQRICWVLLEYTRQALPQASVAWRFSARQHASDLVILVRYSDCESGILTVPCASGIARRPWAALTPSALAV
jgi:hypothetical protein